MAANWLGRPTPLHATSTGKAFLAWLAAEELAAALPGRLQRFTDTTITTRAALRAELADVRARGFAVSRGELEAALWGVSAPCSTPAAPWRSSRLGNRGADPREGLDGLGRGRPPTAGAIAAHRAR